jgi:chromosome segregation ATPase
MVDNLIKTQEEVDAAEKEYKQLTDELDENNKAIDNYKQTIATASQALDTYTNMQMKMEDMHSKTTKSIKEYESALSDAKKDVETYTKALEEMQEAGKKIDDSFDVNNLEKINELADELDKKTASLSDNLTAKGTSYFSEYAKDLRDFISQVENSSIKDMFKDLDRMAEVAEKLDESFSGDNGFMNFDDWISDVTKNMNEFAKLARENFESIPQSLNAIRTGFREVHDALSEYKTAFKDQGTIEDIMFGQADAVEKLSEAQERLNKLQSDDSDKEYQDNLKKVAELKKRIADHAEKRGRIIEQNQWDTNSLKAYENEVEDLTKAADELKEKLQEAQNVMDKGNDVVNQSADEFNEQYKAYEKLSQRVKEYLEDESNAIVKREEAAKSFRQVADAMEKVYSGSSKLNNADLINKTLEEAAKYFKELNLVSTDNLQRDLKRLGEIVDDKAEKIKRFKEANKEFGSDASKAAYGLEKQGEALKEYADSIAFVIKETNVLQKAWGDISVGDVDHLQIRPRIELLDNYEKKLKSAADKIQKFYSETQGPMTQKEQTTLEDWKIWEKNAEEIKEYNKALEEYFTTIMDSGGNIDDKFKDEFGKFDPVKFAKEWKKMGSSSVVISRQVNAVRTEFLEWVKTEKEAREEAVKSAKVALEQAENNKKLANSQEELAEATKEVKKAQEDLNKARENLKNFAKDATDMKKEFGEATEKCRQFGMALDDINKSDVSKVDKSLASIMDSLDAFDNDLPNTFGALMEDVKAVFMDMEGFDFGGVLDGLKDIGAGIFSKIPTELKVALGVATAIGVALKESAEMGIEHFGKGADTIKNALSGIVDIARDIGQEIVSAFENITGMDMDFSSLIEAPIDFESQMAKVGAIAGVTGDAFEELEEEARRLGSTTRYSASEVAQAMEYMGRQTCPVIKKFISKNSGLKLEG